MAVIPASMLAQQGTKQARKASTQYLGFDFIPETPISIKTVIAARSLNVSSLTLQINNDIVTTVNIPNIISTPSTEYAKISSINQNYFSNSSDLDIKLDYLSPDHGAILWLDYIEINARRKLKMSNNILRIMKTMKN